MLVSRNMLNGNRELTFLDQEVDRICRSGALGRSPVYERLLRYLNETTRGGRAPKEADIAVDVFGRGDFDPSTDSSVRVYLHHLRQKLNAYYEGTASDAPRFICIPKGEYRLSVETKPIAVGTAGEARSPRWRAIAASFVGAVALALGVGILGGGWFAANDAVDRAAGTGLWQLLEPDEKPLVVVLGDYYIFGELGRYGNVERLVRDFQINSREDLELAYAQPGSASYTDVRLSYLPLGTGVALADVLGVVRSLGRQVIVVPQSSLDAKTVQSSDILYVGYLSGLGLLKEFVFASSNFELGATFDELVDRDSGRLYVSEAGLPDGPAQDYVDYAFMSTFGGPNGNRVMIVAGMRDEGLMQMASILTSASSIEQLLTEAGNPEHPAAMEALYRVRGMNRMNIAAELVFASGIDQRYIWIDKAEMRPTASSPARSGGRALP